MYVRLWDRMLRLKWQLPLLHVFASLGLLVSLPCLFACVHNYVRVCARGCVNCSIKFINFIRELSAWVSARARAHTHTHTHTTHTHTRTHTDTDTLTQINTHTHTHTHTLTHTHAHTDTDTLTQIDTHTHTHIKYFTLRKFSCCEPLKCVTRTTCSSCLTFRRECIYFNYHM